MADTTENLAVDSPLPAPAIPPSSDRAESIETEASYEDDQDLDGMHIEWEAYGSDSFFFGDGIEDLEQYCPGGLHPIHQGHTLGGGRFKVICKLGAGGFGTVWLCGDNKDRCFVAIKVLSAMAPTEAAQSQGGEFAILKHFRDTANAELEANHICLAKDYFIETGPNGDHICLILPVLGGDIRNVARAFGDEPDVLRGICAQMVTAVKYLHSKGICHGDFRPANILFKIPEFENLTEDEVYQMFPACDEYEVGPIPATGEEPGHHLPKYIYAPAKFQPLPGHKLLDIVVSDFGEAYLVDNQPEALGIPLGYAAPEALVDANDSFGFATDIWALGCTICEVRQGSTPFFTRALFDAVQSIEYDLGPLPEPYRSLWLEGCQQLPPDERTPAGIPLTDPVTTDPEVYQQIRTTMTEDGYTTQLERVLREEHRMALMWREGDVLRPNETLSPDGTLKWREWQLSTKEADQLLDLLSRIIKYAPDERLTSAEIQVHPWVANCISRTSHEDKSIDAANGETVYEVLEMDSAAPSTDGVPGQMQEEAIVSVCPVAEVSSSKQQGPSTKTENRADADAVMTDCPADPSSSSFDAVEGNSGVRDVEDRPAEIVIVDFIARIFNRLVLMFFPAWDMAASCFRR
jgi:serine/threonine protein kinase